MDVRTGIRSRERDAELVVVFAPIVYCANVAEAVEEYEAENIEKQDLGVDTLAGSPWLAVDIELEEV